MTNVKELWTVVRRDNHYQAGFIRLRDLGLASKEIAEQRAAEVPARWQSHHTQTFEVHSYRPGTLAQFLKDNKCELVN